MRRTDFPRRGWSYALLIVTLFAMPTTAGERPTPIKVGKPFPPFEAKNLLTGQPFKLTDLRGKVVLIDFWATWCGPCRYITPDIRRAYEKYHKRGLEIVGISLDKSTDVCKAYIKNKKLDWHHIAESGGWGTRLARKYGIRSIPTLVLLDANGVVTHLKLRRNLDQAIAQVLQKTPPKLDDDSGAAKSANERTATDDDGATNEPAAASTNPQAEESLKSARALNKARQYAEAAAAYETVIRDYPGTPAANHAQKQLAAMRADLEVRAALAKAQLKYRHETVDRQLATWLAAARSLRDAGRTASARKYYERIIWEHPDSEQASVARRELTDLPR